MAGTHEDAQILIQLVRWGSDMSLDEAAHEIFSDGFDPAKATGDSASVRKVLGFGEVVGTLVKNNLLNRELVLDMWWIEGMWGRVGPAAKGMREKAGEPRLYENFEALAAGR